MSTNRAEIVRPARRRRRPISSDTPPAQTIPRPEFSWVNISVPVPYENNPRINEHVVPLVRKSIAAFGFLVPIVLGIDDVVIAGHTRLLAALELQYTEVPVVRAEHLTDEQVQAFRVIDNRLAELASWNRDALASEVQEIMMGGVDLLEYGFQQEELDCLSDIVSEDCLDAGVEDQTSDVTEREQETGTTSTRLVLGEFVIFISTEDYQEWSQELYRAHNYDRAAILAEICERLGVMNARV